MDVGSQEWLSVDSRDHKEGKKASQERVSLDLCPVGPEAVVQAIERGTAAQVRSLT